MVNPSSESDTVDYDLDQESKAHLFGPAPTPVNIDVGAVSHVGKVRTNNEDHYAVVRRRRSRTVLSTNLPRADLPDVDEDAYAMVVADGIGGAAFGDLASRLALRTAGELGIREIKWPLKMNEDEVRETLEKLETYVELLHDELTKHAEADPHLEGMGTTLTAAYTSGTEAFLAHVGDSRAYLFRQGKIRRLTRDHTLAQEMIDSGKRDFSASQMRWMNRILTNCLSTKNEPLHADVRHLTLQDEDRLLLCTDGLSDLVKDAELASVLQGDLDSQRACEALLDLALERGGKDNVTIIVARYQVVPHQSA